MKQVKGNFHCDYLKGRYDFCFEVPDNMSKKEIQKAARKKCRYHINYIISDIPESTENTEEKK